MSPTAIDVFLLYVNTLYCGYIFLHMPTIVDYLFEFISMFPFDRTLMMEPLTAHTATLWCLASTGTPARWPQPWARRRWPRGPRSRLSSRSSTTTTLCQPGMALSLPHNRSCCVVENEPLFVQWNGKLCRNAAFFPIFCSHLSSWQTTSSVQVLCWHSPGQNRRQQGCLQGPCSEAQGQARG